MRNFLDFPIRIINLLYNLKHNVFSSPPEFLRHGSCDNRPRDYSARSLDLVQRVRDLRAWPARAALDNLTSHAI